MLHIGFMLKIRNLIHADLLFNSNNIKFIINESLIADNFNEKFNLLTILKFILPNTVLA